MGDGEGTLLIYDIKSFELYKRIEAHDSEISSLDFTPEND